jgi:hypothetical protein
MFSFSNCLPSNRTVDIGRKSTRATAQKGLEGVIEHLPKS